MLGVHNAINRMEYTAVFLENLVVRATLRRHRLSKRYNALTAEEDI